MSNNRLEKILAEFKRAKNLSLFTKLRYLYTMYEKLPTADNVTRGYYLKLEECLPENVRPSRIVAIELCDGTISVDDKIGIITLRSLIAGLGYHSAPLVRFAKKHNLDESERYYIKDCRVHKNSKTCSVFRVNGISNEGSLGLIPWKMMALVIAIERGETRLVGTDGVMFDNPDNVDMISWATYKWPQLMKGGD